MQKNLYDTTESDMRVVMDIADKYVSSSIELLHADAASAAHRIGSAEGSELRDLLEEQLNDQARFCSLTVIDREGIVASVGPAPTEPEYVKSTYVMKAFAGEEVISTTRTDAAGNTVFHVCVPMAEDRVLSATVDGMYFSNMLNQFKLWGTGNIFMLDNTGVVIASVNEDWVRERVDLIERGTGLVSFKEPGVSGDAVASGGWIAGQARNDENGTATARNDENGTAAGLEALENASSVPVGVEDIAVAGDAAGADVDESRGTDVLGARPLAVGTEGAVSAVGADIVEPFEGVGGEISSAGIVTDTDEPAPNVDAAVSDEALLLEKNDDEAGNGLRVGARNDGEASGAGVVTDTDEPAPNVDAAASDEALLLKKNGNEELGESLRGLRDFVGSMIQGRENTGQYMLNGKAMICVTKPLHSSTVGWTLGLVVPVSESPMEQVRRGLYTTAGIFLVISIAIAIILSRRISRPFEHLKEQNDRLAELRAEAEHASDAKSSFLANTSHEMRTPLNAVIGLSELMLVRDDLEPEVRETMTKISNSGSTLLSIINDLLDISKIESGKFELVDSEYDLPSMINDTVNLNIVRLGSKPVNFMLKIGADMPSRFIGDELRVKQVFNNLLSNAFKYTKSGEVEWSLRYEMAGGGDSVLLGNSGGGSLSAGASLSGASWNASSVPTAGDVWLVSTVRDTGVGIRPDDIKRLFAVYNQVDIKSNRAIEGTGLGLSIVKRLVNQMGGEVTVESEYGKGSVFTVRMLQKRVDCPPLGEETAENLRHFRYVESKRSVGANLVRLDLSGYRVLLVDDVATNLDVARGIMKPYKMTVDCATSGADAIELVRTGERYDAIFMDHMMPVMDGVEAVRVIREEIGTDYARTVPIIALTANALTGNDKMFLSCGFQAFISKPIDIMQLDAVIRQWIYRPSKAKILIEYPSEGDTASHSSPEGALPPLAGRSAPLSPPKGNIVVPSDESLRDSASPEEDDFSRLQYTDSDEVIPADVMPADMIGDAHPSYLSGVLVDGLDIESGLARFGDAASYVEVLASYAANTKNLIGELRRHALDGNLKDYAITVHGIKGSSRGICAEEVGAEAEKLELAAKSGDRDYIERYGEEFILRVETLIHGMSGVIAGAKAARLRGGGAVTNGAGAVSDEPRMDCGSGPAMTNDLGGCAVTNGGGGGALGCIDVKLLDRLLSACNAFGMDDADEAVFEMEQYVYEQACDNELVEWLREKVNTMCFEEIAERLAERGKP
jgi:signal transduction histidine kinase/CheY-like chemotaxis protein